jgi:ABC-type phosphate transport system auxiliary subunit
MTDKNDVFEELQWVKYRLNMLNIIEEKLFIMKGLAQKVQNSSLSKSEIDELNRKLNNLAGQIKALDQESRKNCI